MLSDKDFWEAFCAAPAAKGMHHARIGGLLEHSAQCLRIARTLAELYPVDRDLFLFGMIFHDVGKVRELSWSGGGFAYTTEGRLQGHVVLGDRIFNSYIASCQISRRTLRYRSPTYCSRIRGRSSTVPQNAPAPSKRSLST